MDFSNILGTLSLGAIGTAERSGSSGTITVGLKNLNVRYAEASHSIWVRRLRIFGDTTITITPGTGFTAILDGYTAPIAQVETATAAGTISAAGYATATVTGAGLAEPEEVRFAVALSDTASAWAAKARTAIGANSTISAKYTVSGSGTSIVLTRIVDDYGFANDTTMNIALADDTSAGITEAATSANTTAGELADGALVDEINNWDAEGLEIPYTAGGLRAILVQGVRGLAQMTDDDDFSITVLGKVEAGGMTMCAGPDGGSDLAAGGNVKFIRGGSSVAEVYVVLVTAGA